MSRPLQIFNQSDYLIQIDDIDSHTEWQTVQIQISWLLRSQLIWIYTVCKDRVYLSSAGQGLISNLSLLKFRKKVFRVSSHIFQGRSLIITYFHQSGKGK